MGKNSGLLSRIFSKLSLKNDSEPQKIAETERPELPELKLLFFIIEWSSVNVVSKVFEEKKVAFHFINKGKGTASSEILDILGLGASSKAVIICLEWPAMIPVLIKEVRKILNRHSPGAGIAFTLPLSGVNSPILRIFNQIIQHYKRDEALHHPEHEKPHLERRRGDKHFSHQLILSILNQGFSDEFMNTARAAGAPGGTIIFARGSGHELAKKFFGISMQEEKEIIIILARQNQRDHIMNAIGESHGLKTKAHGIMVSVPVEYVQNLSFEWGT